MDNSRLLIKTVSNYLDSIELQDNDKEKIRIAGEMFSFIANNKEEIIRYRNIHLKKLSKSQTHYTSL